jgi:hypothetical protein
MCFSHVDDCADEEGIVIPSDKEAVSFVLHKVDDGFHDLFWIIIWIGYIVADFVRIREIVVVSVVSSQFILPRKGVFVVRDSATN